MASIHGGARSDSLETPYRPRAIAFVNRAGAALGFGKKPLTVGRLVDRARKSAGLARFDTEDFLVPLGKLVESINAEAHLHLVGRAILENKLVGQLAGRLRAQALFEAHPEILDIPIEAPIVIAGLQRTGTTMLHRLLSEDPGIRALASWEALEPVPKAKPRPRQKEDPRVGFARMAEKGLAYMAPAFFAIHPVEATAPEEEVLLLDYSFLSTTPESTLHVPTFARWLEDQDQTPAYAYMKKLMQLLLWQRPAERWVLKTPHHLEWLDTLFAVFPDAKVVQTHRDPAKTLASFSSMITHGRGVFSDEVDPREVAAHWLRKTSRMVTRAMESRDRVGEASFIDVSYYDLLADPMAEMERIYAFAGRELTAAARARMEASREVNVQNRFGVHSYRLEDFGLSAESVEPYYAAYRARFGVRRE